MSKHDEPLATELFNDPDDFRAFVLLAHGAGAPVDSPFHPPGKPGRDAHPSLVVQEELDSFGQREEVVTYTLSPADRFMAGLLAE